MDSLWQSHAANWRRPVGGPGANALGGVGRVSEGWCKERSADWRAADAGVGKAWETVGRTPCTALRRCPRPWSCVVSTPWVSGPVAGSSRGAPRARGCICWAAATPATTHGSAAY